LGCSGSPEEKRLKQSLSWRLFYSCQLQFDKRVIVAGTFILIFPCRLQVGSRIKKTEEKYLIVEKPDMASKT